MEDKLQKAELIISALQQRIGEMAVDYETKFALLRADFTLLQHKIQELEKVNAVAEYQAEIAEKLQ
jgi:hypothetical protein